MSAQNQEKKVQEEVGADLATIVIKKAICQENAQNLEMKTTVAAVEVEDEEETSDPLALEEMMNQ